MAPWLDPIFAFLAENLGVPPNFVWRILATLAVMVLFTVVQALLARALARTVSDPAVDGLLHIECVGNNAGKLTASNYTGWKYHALRLQQ